MAIEDQDIIEISSASRGERLFLPSVFKGLGTTLRRASAMPVDGKNKNLWVVVPRQMTDTVEELTVWPHSVASTD